MDVERHHEDIKPELLELLERKEKQLIEGESRQIELTLLSSSMDEIECKYLPGVFILCYLSY